MTGGADGSGPRDVPDDEDTVLRPAGGTAAQPAPPPHGASPRDPSSQDHSPLAPSPRHSPPQDPDFIDRAPFASPPSPDRAPIQRFDQRPRFDLPPSPAPPTSPPARPPGIDATTGPRRRGLLVPALAFGCAVVMLLGIGGGLTALWLAGRSGAPAPVADPLPVTTPTGTEPGVWEPLEPGQVPSGEPADLRQVLAQNPLLNAQLDVPSGCALPPTAGGRLPADKLEAFLQEGADCLETTWATALDAEGVAFEGPSVTVFGSDEVPSDTACAAEHFTGSAPVVCRDDNTLYWPANWDPGFSNASAAEAPGLYMWHLSYSYTVFALAAADLDDYYGTLLLALADAPEQAEQAQRRYALQISCLSSAAAFQLPPGVRPAERVEDFVTSVPAQAAPRSAGEPTAETRAAWVGTGQDSGGTLGECAVWTAGADEVA